jgi:hypothetical protein
MPRRRSIDPFPRKTSGNHEAMGGQSDFSGRSSRAAANAD